MKKARAAIAYLGAFLAFTGLGLTGTVAMAADGGGSTLLTGADPAAGATLSQACVACHGPKGNSVQGVWPNIAGQHATYIFKQLQDMKSGERSNPQMAGIVANLNEQEMRDLAAHFSQQPVKIMGASDEELVERGREIYLGGIPSQGVAACVACHGPRGDGNAAARFPRVGGQWAQYLVAQLHAFRSGERSNDPNAAMRSLASKMGDDDIRAVAEYMAGLN